MKQEIKDFIKENEDTLLGAVFLVVIGGLCYKAGRNSSGMLVVLADPKELLGKD